MTPAQVPNESTSPEAPEAEMQTCPNCGRTFEGNYCPQCGHEAGRELSTAEVVGGFFREFVDVERGFWATLKALTLRPGSALQAYLRGAHDRLMSPGRYLLAAVVICYGVDRGLAWVGARASLEEQAPDLSGKDIAPVAREVQMIAWRAFESQGVRIATNLLLAGLVAVVMWRLFRGALDRGAEALALGGFLVGHTVLLEAVVKGLYAPSFRLLTGEPAELSFFLYLSLTVAYVGWVTYRVFGPGWGVAVKGVLGLAWAFLDLAALLIIAPLGYGLWLLRTAPETYPGPEGIAVGFLVTALAAAVPLFVHVGVEAYYRLG